MSAEPADGSPGPRSGSPHHVVVHKPYTGRLAELGERLARVEEKLDAALDMRGEIRSLESRVRTLETTADRARGGIRWVRWALDVGLAIGMFLVALGVWTK